MKKIIAALAGLSLFAAAATAEGITFNAWGRGLWNVIANGQESDGKGGYDDTIVSGVNQSWGGASPRTDLRVHGDSEHIGYSLQIFSNGGDLGTGSDNHIYVKPIDQIKAFLGSTDQDILRGNFCLPLWDWDRIGAVGVVDEEGWTFADYLDVSRGTSIVVTPIEGLTIGAAIDFPDFAGHDIGTVWGGAKGGDQTDIGGRYVAAYTIEGIGTIKAALDTRRKHARGPTQVYFYDDGDEEAWAKVEENFAKTGTWDYSSLKKVTGQGIDGDVMEVAAAFDLVAVENLNASIGAVIPTDGKEIKVNLGAHYTLDALGIYALVGTKINGLDTGSGTDTDGFYKDAGKFGIRAGVAVDYTLENGIGFFGEVQFANDVWMGGDDANVTFGAGVAKGFSNGKLGIAFEGSTTGNRFTKESDKFGFEVPVKFEYWF